MKIYDALTSIYKDKFFKEYSSGDVLIVSERDGKPKVKEVQIDINSEVTYIDSEFLHNVTSKYYRDNQCKPELQHDCDGVLIIIFNNTLYLVFLELKSDYTIDNIVKAEKQISTSYFRLIRHLLPFKCFNFYSCKVCGVIISLPIGVETKRKIRNKKNVGRTLSRFEQQAEHFTKKKNPYLLKSEYTGMDKLLVYDSYVMSSFPIFHIDANAGTTNMDIYKILRRL